MAITRGINEIISDCHEFLVKIDNPTGDSTRKLVKSLQELTILNYESISSHFIVEIKDLLHLIWNHPILLEDCILVSGIIFAKFSISTSFPTFNSYENICELAGIQELIHSEWVGMSLLRGLLLKISEKEKSPELLQSLALKTFSFIDEALKTNRIVLLSRHLENLLQIFTIEYTQNPNSYNLSARGQQQLVLITQTLRLKVDLVDYKSRDLIKWHLSVIFKDSEPIESESLVSVLESDTTVYIEAVIPEESQTESEPEIFIESLLTSLPEMNKISIQIYDNLLSLSSATSKLSERFITSLYTRIFDLSLPCLRIKGGLCTAAVSCIAKLLASPQAAPLVTSKLLTTILNYNNSRDTLKVFKLILQAVDDSVKALIYTSLKEILSLSPVKKFSSPINQFLLLIARRTAQTTVNVDVNNEMDCASLEIILQSADEFVALETFSLLLLQESSNSPRKPTDPIPATFLSLLQRFMEAVLFSGSVDFRQKVSTVAKSFYEQIFARIYHLSRELLKNRNNSLDLSQEELELKRLFNFLANYIKNSLISPFDFCRSNFGSVEFACTQILAILDTFSGNVTLVAANPRIIENINENFRSAVIVFAIRLALDNFINCVGGCTYDYIRLLTIDILCKCHVDKDLIPLDKYLPGLNHPRAINNEGAARIVLLHSRLSQCSRVTLVLDELAKNFEKLRSSFPASLKNNNVNGRLLLLRFLLEDRPAEITDKDLAVIIDLSIEISEFVSLIASHPSPEGSNYLEESEDESEEIEDLECLCFDDSSVSNQYISSFSWRAIKETSLLLEVLLKNYSSRLSPYLQIQPIAYHFISLLLKLRHCGAFTALQAPLTTALRLGFSFSEKLDELQRILVVCLGTGEISTTRRSAGLPFLVLALAHSCSGRGNELDQLLSSLLPSLLLKAQSNLSSDHSSSSIGLDLEPSVIHAFNITRSLVRDSRIAVCMGTHMAFIAKLCLDSFNSSNWNVRNASSMLLSSLITKIFGPKHVNDLLSTDHHVDLREIEVKFEGLLEIIIKFLQVAPQTLEPRIAYPLLAILERIKIPPHERFNDFRGSVINFLCELLKLLENHQESGRKLSHVLSRTVFSLIHSKSLAIEILFDKILVKIEPSSPNGVYNYLVLFEVISENCNDIESSKSESCESSLHPNLLSHKLQLQLQKLPPLNENWHQILKSKYNKVLSHKSLKSPNFFEQIGAPVLNIERVLEELPKKLPDLLLIIRFLDDFNYNVESKSSYLELQILTILETFKLNEEIVSRCLRILCSNASDDSIHFSRLRNHLNMYATAENNENLRFIALESLKYLDPGLLTQVPKAVLSLLLDDDEELRGETCQLLNWLQEIPVNPAETLQNFIILIGLDEFSRFLDDHNCNNDDNNTSNNNNMKLFEKEPLNLFIDIQYLRKKYIYNNNNKTIM